VGKSSLLNRLLGEDRVIVTPIAGTTRDSIDTRIEFEGREVVLVDTAGLRRRTKVAGSIDYYAQLRSEQAADRAQVAIVVGDAAEGVTSEDLRIAEMAMKKKCATVVALNKWDVTRTDLEDAKARVAKKLRQRPQVLAVSAASGRGLKRLVAEALSLADRSSQWIPTPELNRFLGDSRASASRPRCAASGCACTTWPSTRRARRASRSRSRTAAWSRATTPTSSRTGCARRGACRACRW
jgi:GTP-binding protein